MSQTGLVLLFAAIASHGHQVRAEQAEVRCMTEALYYEARGEGQNGQEAVAEVILQRVRSRAHPDSICGVVHEPGQFSYVTDGSTKRPRDQESWQAAKNLAARIVRGELVTSLTRRALFYHAVDVQPAWAAEMVRTAVIGNHIFYRLPGARERQQLTQVRPIGQPETTAAAAKSRDA
jgi:spore germination cell wall hydrolase CwlJ-like protein